MNLNQLAKAITELEGGKVNLPIAQVKEVLHCLGAVLVDLDMEEALVIVARLAKVARSRLPL